MSEELMKRDIDSITEEIQELKTEAQCTAVYYICKIGKKHVSESDPATWRMGGMAQ